MILLYANLCPGQTRFHRVPSLTKRFLNEFRVIALTTTSDRLFYWSVTRSLNDNLLTSFFQLSLYRWYLYTRNILRYWVGNLGNYRSLYITIYGSMTKRRVLWVVTFLSYLLFLRHCRVGSFIVSSLSWYDKFERPRAYLHPQRCTFAIIVKLLNEGSKRPFHIPDEAWRWIRIIV